MDQEEYTFNFESRNGWCNVCSLALTSWQHASQHVEGKIHRNRTSGLWQFENKTQLLPHTNSSGNELSVRCDTTQKEHVFSGGNHWCLICKLPLNTIEQLNIHRQSPKHLEKKAKKEQYRQFGNKVNLQTWDKNNTYSCPICKEEINSLNNLSAHMALHATGRYSQQQPEERSVPKHLSIRPSADLVNSDSENEPHCSVTTTAKKTGQTWSHPNKNSYSDHERDDSGNKTVNHGSRKRKATSFLDVTTSRMSDSYIEGHSTTSIEIRDNKTHYYSEFSTDKDKETIMFTHKKQTSTDLAMTADEDESFRAYTECQGHTKLRRQESMHTMTGNSRVTISDEENDKVQEAEINDFKNTSRFIIKSTTIYMPDHKKITQKRTENNSLGMFGNMQREELGKEYRNKEPLINIRQKKTWIQILRDRIKPKQPNSIVQNPFVTFPRNKKSRCSQRRRQTTTIEEID